MLSTSRLDAIIVCTVGGLLGQLEGSRTGNPSRGAIPTGDNLDFFLSLLPQKSVDKETLASHFTNSDHCKDIC